MRSAAVVVGATVAVAAAGCLGTTRDPFVPSSVPRDSHAEETLARLRERINSKDPRGICELYASPSGRCVATWRRRIAAFATPVHFSMRRLIFGCAGDARLLFVESSRNVHRLRTLTLISSQPGVYTLIIDFPIGNRRSSLVVPATGTCGNPGDNIGGIAAENRDPASVEGAGRRAP
jgi:hypothetical protein